MFPPKIPPVTLPPCSEQMTLPWALLNTLRPFSMSSVSVSPHCLSVLLFSPFLCFCVWMQWAGILLGLPLMQALTPSTAFFYPLSSGLPCPCPFSTESLFPACSLSGFVLGLKDTAVSRAETGPALRFSLSFILTKQRKTEHHKHPSHDASPLSFALLSFSRTFFVLILLTAFPCVHSL